MKLKNMVSLVIVLGFIVISGTAVARVQTAYLVVNPTDFSPEIDFDWRLTDKTLGTIGVSGAIDLSVRAPVHLPHGAKITKAELYYTEENSGEGGSVIAVFCTYDMAQDDFQYVFNLDSNNGESGVQSVKSAVLNIAIDNSHNAYTIILEISNGATPLNELFRGLVITYQYNSANTVVIPLP